MQRKSRETGTLMQECISNSNQYSVLMKVMVPVKDKTRAKSMAPLLAQLSSKKKASRSLAAMIQTTKMLLENGDGVCEKIMQCQRAAMEFHENLNNIGVKEGLKGRKLHKALENFTWNITVLKVINY
ncbi:hypothetical protein scyTo_0005643 [Scyliorhinus torazame]|uniref:Uncharacterized protein n=1 Tax=Scyliorhinus torazame TaxID=75743 RepID=A0A401PB13_SCYTO|nr:hypothetical protein [Scyliorhinus torazame]